MNRKLFTLFGKPISSWPLSHFILFFITGYLFAKAPRKYWVLIFFAGVLWEAIEVLMKKLNTKNQERVRIDENMVHYTIWWESNVDDIVYDTLGLILGVIVGNIYSYKNIHII
jgi:hypothetical protein